VFLKFLQAFIGYEGRRSTETGCFSGD